MGKYIKSLGNPLQELLSPRHYVYVCFWATPLPPSRCGRPLCMAPFGAVTYRALDIQNFLSRIASAADFLHFSQAEEIPSPPDTLCLSRLSIWDEWGCFELVWMGKVESEGWRGLLLGGGGS